MQFSQPPALAPCSLRSVGGFRHFGARRSASLPHGKRPTTRLRRTDSTVTAATERLQWREENVPITFLRTTTGDPPENLLHPATVRYAAERLRGATGLGLRIPPREA
jgi:hypothetical protein